MNARTILIVMTLTGCFVAPVDQNPDSGPLGGGSSGGGGGSTADAGADGGTASFVRCVDLIPWGEVCATVTSVVCSGVPCSTDEVCCQTTGACVARGSSACPIRPTDDPNHQTACGSNADCASTEYCVPDSANGSQPQRCIGPSGHCQPLSNCAFCGAAPGTDICQVCGCNGVTYASPQEACVAGVTAPTRGACGAVSGDGTISCGTSAQCPTGSQCCAVTGKCFDSSQPWRCQPQPDGMLLNCATDADCNGSSGAGGGSGGPGGFCGGEGCAASPGRCLSIGSGSSCGGAVRTVCGCDGTTYVNDCWARAGGTRVAHVGACP